MEVKVTSAPISTGRSVTQSGPDARRRARRAAPHRAAALLVAAILTAACGSATPSSSPPGATGADATARSSDGASAPQPSAPDGQPTTPTTSTSDPPFDPSHPNLNQHPPITDADVVPAAHAPLPEPLLSDPSAIADALYSPDGMGIGVMSLLDQMGIDVVDRAGAVSRAARGPKSTLALTEDEVQGLIAMGSQDAAKIIPGMPGGSPITFADLHAALAPLLHGMSVDELATRYTDAYADHADSLVGGIFGVQGLRPDTGLTRVHVWLLLMDGFVHDALAAPGAATSGVVLAAWSGPTWGIADPALPLLASPDPRLSVAGFALLLAHLPALAYSIPLDSDPAVSAHEGHGGPGQQARMTARIGVPGVLGLVDPITHAPLLLPSGQSAAGIGLTWQSSDTAVIDAHGSLDQPLAGPTTTDTTGAAAIAFLPKEEAANGQGDVVEDVATLRATVGVRDLVTHFFTVSPAVVGLLMGDRQAQTLLEIGWHEEAGLDVQVTSYYNSDAVFFVQPFLPTFQGKAQRVGTDSASGFLALQPDGTYAGSMRAKINLTSVFMEFGATTCRFTAPPELKSGQWLHVVGRPAPNGSWSRFDRTGNLNMVSGSVDSEPVQLSFWPAGPPVAWPVWCLTPIGLTATTPETESVRYAPFNDLAWTEPTKGFEILTPSKGTASYRDSRFNLDPFAAGVLTQLRPNTEIWLVTVTRTGPPP